MSLPASARRRRSEALVLPLPGLKCSGEPDIDGIIVCLENLPLRSVDIPTVENDETAEHAELDGRRRAALRDASGPSGSASRDGRASASSTVRRSVCPSRVLARSLHVRIHVGLGSLGSLDVRSAACCCVQLALLTYGRPSSCFMYDRPGEAPWHARPRQDRRAPGRHRS
jgi:hypothetical protein